MLALWMSLVAHAASVEAVLARVDEVAPLRAKRLVQGAPDIPREAYEQAAKGKVATGLEQVEGHKARKVWGVGIVDVPISRYWAAINDDLSKVTYTKLTYVEVVSGAPCTSPRRVFQFVPIPLVTDRWWLIDITANKDIAAQTQGRVREQRWRTNGDFTTPTPESTAWAAKGMHLDSTQGGWFLIDLDGKTTLVEYYAWADPGGSLPASLVSSLAERSVDDTIAQFTTLAKAGPTCPLW